MNSKTHFQYSDPTIRRRVGVFDPVSSRKFLVFVCIVEKSLALPSQLFNTHLHLATCQCGFIKNNNFRCLLFASRPIVILYATSESVPFCAEAPKLRFRNALLLLSAVRVTSAFTSAADENFPAAERQFILIDRAGAPSVNPRRSLPLAGRRTPAERA